MMHPDLMRIVVEDHQAQQRRLAAVEPFAPGIHDAAIALRRYLGGAMVRLGFWLGGHAPQTTAQPGLPSEAVS